MYVYNIRIYNDNENIMTTSLSIENETKKVYDMLSVDILRVLACQGHQIANSHQKVGFHFNLIQNFPLNFFYFYKKATLTFTESETSPYIRGAFTQENLKSTWQKLDKHWFTSVQCVVYLAVYDVAGIWPGQRGSTKRNPNAHEQARR